jgi:hypothetical protein
MRGLADRIVQGSVRGALALFALIATAPAGFT